MGYNNQHCILTVAYQKAPCAFGVANKKNFLWVDLEIHDRHEQTSDDKICQEVTSIFTDHTVFFMEFSLTTNTKLFRVHIFYDYKVGLPAVLM